MARQGQGPPLPQVWHGSHFATFAACGLTSVVPLPSISIAGVTVGCLSVNYLQQWVVQQEKWRQTGGHEL